MRTRPARRALGVSLAAAVLTFSACSGDAGDETSADPSEPASEAVATVETEAVLGKVRGTIDAAASQAALDEVTAVVDGWIDGAYGGDYPRSDFGGAFAAFTADARALAEKQPTVLSNAAVGADLEEVEITDRRVAVDLLAAKGRAAAATARVDVGLVLDEGQSDVVSGRLLLTHGKNGWSVFGFDLNRGQEGA